MSDPAAAIWAATDVIREVGVGGALMGIALASLGIFCITYAQTLGKTMGENSGRVAATAWRRIANWLVALGAARTRRKARERILESALADLDAAEDDGQRGWALVREGIALAWTQPVTAAYASGRAVRRHDPQRVFNLLVALLLVGVLIPVLAVISIAILAELGWPIVFRQRRVGRNGQVFWLHKFRTLRPDGRVSRLGHFLRKTSIDELPQLFNVLRGDMDLVGPRPPLATLEDDLDADHPRTRVRPGMTGLWQTDGDESDDQDDVDELDRQYVEERSFSFDLKILLRTAVKGVRKRRSSPMSPEARGDGRERPPDALSEDET